MQDFAPTPSAQRRHLLVLDLDETLIYASEQPLDYAHDFKLASYFVYRRPHLQAFLQYVFTQFEVGVWTSSSEKYAIGVVKEIFGDLQPAFVWADRRCTLRLDFDRHEYVSRKRLAKLKSLGYRLEQIIVIDDSPEKHTQNYGNLVRVAEFTGQRDDHELFSLQQWLPCLLQVPNVRKLEKRFWRMQVADLNARAAK